MNLVLPTDTMCLWTTEECLEWDWKGLEDSGRLGMKILSLAVAPDRVIAAYTMASMEIISVLHEE